MLHQPMRRGVFTTMIFLGAMILTLWFAGSRVAHAEYGDIVLNNYSDAAGVRPVVFPHWFHRIRFTCKVCHADLGFKFKAGADKIDMLKIIDGQYCGACHNGDIAWSTERCDLCHSGKPGLPTQVQETTPIKEPVAPVSSATSGKK